MGEGMKRGGRISLPLRKIRLAYGANSACHTVIIFSHSIYSSANSDRTREGLQIYPISICPRSVMGTFYEQVFATQPFYGWDEGPEDRGVKYDLASTKLVLLTQENPFPTSGAVHFQLQVPTLEDIYPRAQAAGAVTQEPFFRPYGWHMFRMADPAGNHINIYTVPTTTE